MFPERNLLSLLWRESVVCGRWIDRLLQSGLISYSRGMSCHVLGIWLTRCEGDHSFRKFPFPCEASKVEVLDLMEGGFGVGYPVSLSPGFVSVLSVWTHLLFQVTWL